jgi:hypothetical protein
VAHRGDHLVSSSLSDVLEFCHFCHRFWGKQNRPTQQLAKSDSLYGMSDISSTEREKFGDLSAEQYELLLFRVELVEGGRPGTVEFVLPLVDRRLQEIRSELERLGLPSSTPQYADAVRDSEEELADIAARLRKDATESI